MNVVRDPVTQYHSNMVASKNLTQHLITLQRFYYLVKYAYANV